MGGLHLLEAPLYEGMSFGELLLEAERVGPLDDLPAWQAIPVYRWMLAAVHRAVGPHEEGIPKRWPREALERYFERHYAGFDLARALAPEEGCAVLAKREPKPWYAVSLAKPGASSRSWPEWVPWHDPEPVEPGELARELIALLTLTPPGGRGTLGHQRQGPAPGLLAGFEGETLAETLRLLARPYPREEAERDAALFERPLAFEEVNAKRGYLGRADRFTFPSRLFCLASDDLRWVYLDAGSASEVRDPDLLRLRWAPDRPEVGPWMALEAQLSEVVAPPGAKQVLVGGLRANKSKVEVLVDSRARPLEDGERAWLLARWEGFARELRGNKMMGASAARTARLEARMRLAEDPGADLEGLLARHRRRTGVRHA